MVIIDTAFLNIVNDLGDVLRKMKVTKTECKQLITAYNAAKEALRSEIPTSVWNQILGSATRSNMNTLTAYIINS